MVIWTPWKSLDWKPTLQKSFQLKRDVKKSVQVQSNVMYCCQKTWACFFLFVCYDSNILNTLFVYKRITHDNFWICLLNTKSFYHGPIEGDIYSWTSNIRIYFEHQYLQVFGDFSCTLRPNYHFLITVWKAYFLTLQTSLNHLSCKLITLLLLVWLWHILVSGQ